MLASLRQSVSCRYVRPRPAIYVAQLFCQRLTANKRHFWTNAQEKHFIDIKPKPWYPPELEFAYHNIQHPSSPDVDLWIKCLEGFLPEDLRQQDSLGSTLPVSTTANVFGYLLSKARDYAELDLLWHMGVVQERWDVVAHIVKIVAREWVPRGKSLDRVQTASGINWPKEVLDSITDAPIELDNITSSNIGENYLDFMTGEDEDTRWMEWGLQHKRFGQIWRSLGNMILFASAQSSEDSKKIMKHVLELLAMLHHHSIIPESTYNAPVSSGPAALQQPPTLHILSSRILTALSDAAWNAHITSAVAAANKVNPLAAKNYEVPGSRHKVFVGQLGHEVWLELVLWSCLHGGWALDGAKILEKMQEYKGDLSWSLISWKDVFEFSNLSTKPATLSDWIQVKYEADRNQSAASPEARRVVERTVSVELIAAYVDGLVNTIHVGVGDRGTYPGEVLHHLEHLKLLLDRHKMGLGFTTWENVLIRLQESGGVVLENDPQLMLKILGLIQPYGKEFESVNNRIPSTHTSPSVPDYIFDSSAASLGLLHRVLKSFIDRKDVGGALDAFSAVQFFTDLNKRRSLETFFQDLRNPTIRNQLERRGHFFSSTPAEEIYPALFPQIPFTVLGPLLELMAEAKLFALGDHLIYAKDIDGPVIPSDQYRSRPNPVRRGQRPPPTSAARADGERARGDAGRDAGHPARRARRPPRERAGAAAVGLSGDDPARAARHPRALAAARPPAAGQAHAAAAARRARGPRRPRRRRRRVAGLRHRPAAGPGAGAVRQPGGRGGHRALETPRPARLAGVAGRTLGCVRGAAGAAGAAPWLPAVCARARVVRRCA